MEKVCVLFCYGGEWITGDSGASYIGGEELAIRMQRNCNFQQLRDRAMQLLNTDTSPDSIEMKYAARTSVGSVKYLRVVNDESVDCFLNHGLSMVPLYVAVSTRGCVGNGIGHALFSSQCSNTQPAEPSAGGIASEHVEADHVTEVAVEHDVHIQCEVPICTPDPQVHQAANPSGVNVQNPPVDEDLQTECEGHIVSPEAPVHQVADHSPDQHVGGDTNLSEETEMSSDVAELFVAKTSLEEEGVLKIGSSFKDKESLQDFLMRTALYEKWEFRVKKSTPSLYLAVCANSGCDWRIRGVKTKNSTSFVISRYREKHSCKRLLDFRREHRNAGARVVAGIIKHKFTEPNRVYKPADIQSDILREHGIKISYQMAWLAKCAAQDAVFGTHEAGYALLPSYCHVLEAANPGTITAIETEMGSDNFLYFFMAIGQCIKGFLCYIRPVIGVDATFLTGKYRGTLLVATALDGNGNCYPLAWCICNNENNSSWLWFFQKLRLAIGDVQDLVIVSDRHESIANACIAVFPTAAYGNCIKHIRDNIKSGWKLGVNDFNLNIFMQAANSYDLHTFEWKFSMLRKDIQNYLRDDIGFVRWARVHCPTTRYSIMTTNIVESLNSMLVKPREYPVVRLIEFIRQKMQVWFYQRRLKAENCQSFLTPDHGETKLLDSYKAAENLTVLPINEVQFEVLDGKQNGHVDLNLRTCSCRRFQLDGVPCSHAVAAALSRCINPYELCDRYYHKATWLSGYQESVYPVGPDNTWTVPENVRSRILLPPIPKGRSGRRRKRRIRSAADRAGNSKCGLCGLKGHYRSTCGNPPLRQA